MTSSSQVDEILPFIRNKKHLRGFLFQNRGTIRPKYSHDELWPGKSLYNFACPQPGKTVFLTSCSHALERNTTTKNPKWLQQENNTNIPRTFSSRSSHCIYNSMRQLHPLAGLYCPPNPRSKLLDHSACNQHSYNSLAAFIQQRADSFRPITTKKSNRLET